MWGVRSFALVVATVACLNAQTANWLFRADLECRWSVDGKDMGVLRVEDRKSVPLGLGDHLIEAIPVAGGSRWEQVITVKDARAGVFTIPLTAFESTKEKDDAQAATRKRGYWIDASTKLIWALEESGFVNWNEGVKYCQQFSLGGAHDWRLPSIEELEELNHSDAPGAPHSSDIFWTTNQGLKRGEMWTLSRLMGRLSRPANENGMISGMPNSAIMASRALCVRSVR
jgi:hypothetical protein